MATGTLSGAQKAALVLLQMNREQSAQVMRQMSDNELSEISFEIARLTTVEDQAVLTTVDEFNDRMAATVTSVP